MDCLAPLEAIDVLRRGLAAVVLFGVTDDGLFERRDAVRRSVLTSPVLRRDAQLTMAVDGALLFGSPPPRCDHGFRPCPGSTPRFIQLQGGDSIWILPTGFKLMPDISSEYSPSPQTMCKDQGQYTRSCGPKPTGLGWRLQMMNYDRQPHIVRVGKRERRPDHRLRICFRVRATIRERIHLGFEGKGANQAGAARLCGARVSMVARVGTTVRAATIENFTARGIDASLRVDPRRA